MEKFKWQLRKGTKITSDKSIKLGGEVQRATFLIAPRRVTVTPKLRISIQDTLGGKVIMPWIDPQTGKNIGNIDVRMEGVGNVYLKNPQGQKGREALNELYSLTLDSYMKPNSRGELVEEIWELKWMTPTFTSGESEIVVYGYVTEPMTITESSDSPWLPGWSIGFSFWGGQIGEFLMQIRKKS